jgi:hypothetical protein
VNGKQHAVLWLGLILIIVRLFTTEQWHDIWTSISNGSNLPGISGSSSNLSTAATDKIVEGLPNAPGSSNGYVKLLPNGIPILNPADYSKILKGVGL